VPLFARSVCPVRRVAFFTVAYRSRNALGVMIELETACGAKETCLLGPESASGERFVPPTSQPIEQRAEYDQAFGGDFIGVNAT